MIKLINIPNAFFTRYIAKSRLNSFVVKRLNLQLKFQALLITVMIKKGDSNTILTIVTRVMLWCVKEITESKRVKTYICKYVFKNYSNKVNTTSTFTIKVIRWQLWNDCVTLSNTNSKVNCLPTLFECDSVGAVME
jgi:hypothetical protein